MVRKAQTQAVTAKMYQHFAMLTLAVTLVLGVFASGDGPTAVAGELAATPTPQASRPTELARKDNTARGSFGNDAPDANFGAPMDGVGASAGDGVIPAGMAAEPPAGLPAGYNQYGISFAEWVSLSDAQRKAVIAQHQAEQAAARAAERTEQVSSLLEASRARSGAATVGD